MTNNAHNPDNDRLTTEVRQLFAEVTHYPLYLLRPDSALADDLGIDERKVDQVLTLLRERFDLPDRLEMAPGNGTSIAGIADALASSLRMPGGDPSPRPDPANGNNGGNGSSGNGSVSAAAAPSPGAAAPRPPGEPTALAEQVREVFAEVTRYPLEILTFEASLEEELGIDSVKLGEVFSVLRERFDLPEERIGIPEEQLRTIGGIAESLGEFLGAAAPAATPPAATEPAPVRPPASAPAPAEPPTAAPPAAGDGGDLLAEVRGIFAEVTRYPLEILTPEAALEEDLGIDSVKLGEVFSVLRERFDLPEERIGIPEEQLATIGGIAQAMADHLGGAPAAAAPAAAAPAPVDPAAAATVTPSATAASPAPAPAAPPPDAATLAGSFAALTPEVRPFAGKVAFVSGSGRGLGKEIATYLAELGAHVVINSFHSRQAGIETAEQIRERGGKADHIWGSVANPQQLSAIFDQIEQQVGHLDFFVSNASNGMLARLSDITVEHWEKAFRTNVVGLHQSALRAAALMRRRSGGKIITMSSPAAHGYVDYFGCMGAVKAAVESLTRSLAVELAPDNIQVNCVSPGPVYGDLLDKWPESERLIAQWEDNTAYERLCEARDVAHFVAYLLSEPVKLFTGSVLIMDGGISSQGW